MNPNDIHDETHTGDTDSGTLTGEAGPTPVAPAPKAKNKNNIALFAGFGVIGVLVLAAGYVAFIRKPSPPAAVVVNPPAATTPALNPPASASTAPAVTASAPVRAPLTSAEDAQALLGGTPAPASTTLPVATAQPAAASSAASILGATPSPASTAQAVVAQPAPATTAAAVSPTIVNPPAGSPVVVNPAHPVGTTPGAPVVINPTASSSTAPAVTVLTPAPTSAQPVLPPQAQVTTPAAPSTGAVASSDAALEARVSHLEDRLTTLENGQGRILELLTNRPAAHKASADAVKTSVSHDKPVVVRRRAARQPVNSVEVLTKKDVTVSKPVSVTPKVEAGCKLASIVPNRAWTKQGDGTFLTYGVGDTAPNGSVIKSIDPQSGIVTSSGKLSCPMAD